MNSATYIIRTLLLIVAVTTPWFFGGVWADVQWILLLCLAVQLAFDLMSRFGQYDQPSWLPTAWLPVLFGIALGVCQLVPLSPSTAAWLAPETLSLRTQLSTPATLDESTDIDESSEVSLATADAATLPNFPRSINPAATREYLALLLLGAAVYVLASCHLVDRRSVTILFATVAICGAALAFFGLVQRLSWNGKFYWVFEPLSGSFQSFGPFVNRNNAGGFLNMCLATCLGLIVWVFWSGFQELQYVPVEHQSSSRRAKRSRGSSSGRSSSSRSGRSSRRTRSSSGSSANRSTSADSGFVSPSSDAAADKADQYAAMLGHASSDSRDSDQVDSVSDHSETADQITPIGNSDPNQETERSQDESEQPEKRKRVRVRVKQRVRVHDQDDDDDVDLLEFRRRQKKIRKKFDADEDYEKAKKSLKLATPMAYGANVDPEAGSWIVRGAKATSRWIGEINALKLWSVVLAVCVAGGVFCTASRGSILAMLVSLVVTAGMLAMRAGYRGHSIGILVTLFLGLGLMSWGGQTDFVVNRFEQMFDDNSLEQGRVPNWNEALRTVPDFWSFGTGLGTYRFVYERFQERFLRNTSHFHAENQFIQTMVEGGLLGTALLMLVLLLVGTSIFKLFQSGGAIDTALATMGTFALTSQIIGGTFDFGLYIPSNTILMALLCGVVIGRAALISAYGQVEIERSEERSYQYSGNTRTPTPLPDRGWIALLQTIPCHAIGLSLVTGLLFVGALFGSLEMKKVAAVENAMRAAPLSMVRDLEDPHEIRSLTTPLTNALKQRWDDAYGHRHLAELLIHLYEANAYQTLRLAKEEELAILAAQAEAAAATSSDDNASDLADSNSTEASAAEPAASSEIVRDEELWLRASVWHLHGVLKHLEISKNQIAIDKLLSQPAIQEYLVPARKHLLLARRFCPTVPYTHYALAELSIIGPPENNDVLHLQRARFLSPADATLLYWSGVVDMNSNRANQACENWRKSLTLTKMHLDSIIPFALEALTPQQLLDNVLPDHADQIYHAATKYFSDPLQLDIQMQYLKKAESVIDDVSLPDDEKQYLHASILRLQGRGDEAIELFEKAIQLNPDRIRWRYELARLLFGMQHYKEARKHTSELIREDPDNRQYSELNGRVVQELVKLRQI